MIDVASFRAAIPAFGSVDAFPDASVQFWLTQAPTSLNLAALGNEADLASCYFVAHNLTLAKQDANAAANGSFGQVTGPVTSRSVGGVSKSIDTSSSAFGGAGFYNATSYGRQLYALLRRYSLGGVYAGPGHFQPDLSLLTGGGWLPPFGYQ